MSDAVGSASWIRIWDKFCVVLGNIWLSHFQDCVVQATLEDNLKLCEVLGRRAGSLRAMTT